MMAERKTVRERGFTADLWRSIDPIYAEILAHPFLQGLTDGTLPKDCFRHYVTQDALYLRDYARSLALAGIRSPSEDAFLMFNEHAVGAIATVNAAGSIVDPATGRVVAGVRSRDGRSLEDVRGIVRGERLPQAPAPDGADAPVPMNTTVVIVATNAKLTKAQANAVAKMAQAGLARAVLPVFTLADGDTVFVLATGTWEGAVDVSAIGGLAAEAVSDAILRAVRAAESIPGFPAARDIRR